MAKETQKATAAAEQKNKPTEEAQAGLQTGIESTSGAQSNEPATVLSQPASPTSPNDRLELSEFDYTNLKGEPFRKYLEMVNSLRLDDKYDFEEHVVKPIKQERFEGIENSPVDIVGVNLLSPGKPEKVTRMALKHAIAFNGRIALSKNGQHFTVAGGQWTEATNARCVYYLLKK